MTAEELNQFAKDYSDAADALQDYLERHPELSELEIEAVQGRMGRALKAADDFENRALEIAMKNAETAVEELRKATLEAKHALAKLEEAERVLKVAAALADLGAVILDPTPGKVAGALRALSDASRPSVTASGS